MSSFSSNFADDRFQDLLKEYDGDYYRAEVDFSYDPHDDDCYNWFQSWMNLDYISSNEVWKQISFAHMYDVSSFGNVRSWISSYRNKAVPHIMSTYHNKHGHRYVDIQGDDGVKHKCLVHRLAAEAFLPNPKNNSYVCHKNDIPTDNNIKNLYWGTPRENSFDSWENGTYFHKSVYCRETGVTYPDAREAADRLYLNYSSISNICNRKRGESRGYHFCFDSEKDYWLVHDDEWLSLDKKHTKPVKATNLDTGEVSFFESRQDAAYDLGIPDCGISSTISGRTPHSHRWFFENISWEEYENG